MARPEIIKETEILHGSADTYRYSYEGWNISARKSEEGLTYMFSGADRGKIYPHAEFIGGEVLFHFPSGNAYSSEQIPALCESLNGLYLTACAMKEGQLSVQALESDERKTRGEGAGKSAENTVEAGDEETMGQKKPVPEISTAPPKKRRGRPPKAKK